MSICLATCLCIYLSNCLSVYLSVCLSVCRSISLSIYLSIYHAVSTYLSIHLSIFLSISAFTLNPKKKKKKKGAEMTRGRNDLPTKAETTNPQNWPKRPGPKRPGTLPDLQRYLYFPLRETLCHPNFWASSTELTTSVY